VNYLVKSIGFPNKLYMLCIYNHITKREKKEEKERKREKKRKKREEREKKG
jgi:hypothetical protein